MLQAQAKQNAANKPAVARSLKAIVMANSAIGAFKSGADIDKAAASFLRTARRRDSADELVAKAKSGGFQFPRKAGLSTGTTAVETSAKSAQHVSSDAGVGLAAKQQMDRIEQSIAELSSMMMQMSSRNDRLSDKLTEVCREVEFTKSALGAQAAFIDKALGTADGPNGVCDL